MGIKDLNKLIKQKAPASITEIGLSEFTGQRFAVDVNSYLYQYCYDAGRKGRGAHIRGFMEMISSFCQHGIEPIFIFDGRASSAKEKTLEKRQAAAETRNTKSIELGSEIAEIIATGTGLSVTYTTGTGTGTGTGDQCSTETEFDLESFLLESGDKLDEKQLKEISQKMSQIEKNNKNNIVVTSQMYRDLERLFTLAGFQYLRAREEADFLCVKLCKNGTATAVVSEDFDMLTHGAPILIRGINDTLFRREKKIKAYNRSKLLEILSLDNQKFVDMCILCGCDYTDSPKGIGSLTAIKLITEHGSIEKIVELCKQKKLRYNTDGFSYEQARIEFKKSDHEPVPIQNETSSLNLNEKELLNFLLEQSNYTKITAEKKINDIKVRSNKKKIVITVKNLSGKI